MIKESPASGSIRYYRGWPVTVLSRWFAGNPDTGIWLCDLRVEVDNTRIDAVPEATLRSMP
jgi:hypothetical protein